jgi:GTP-binding protein HflX
MDALRHAFEGDEPIRFNQRVNRERFKREGI